LKQYRLSFLGEQMTSVSSPLAAHSAVAVAVAAGIGSSAPSEVALSDIHMETTSTTATTTATATAANTTTTQRANGAHPPSFAPSELSSSSTFSSVHHISVCLELDRVLCARYIPWILPFLPVLSWIGSDALVLYHEFRHFSIVPWQLLENTFDSTRAALPSLTYITMYYTAT
jgi:hypothetical protein